MENTVEGDATLTRATMVFDGIFVSICAAVPAANGCFHGTPSALYAAYARTAYPSWSCSSIVTSLFTE
ncbi:MAG: hypothetical protein LBB62_07135 [Proteiniphilum sp.]|nr:hypothetical protein [Proteiniphilum sp.]